MGERGRESEKGDIGETDRERVKEAERERD